MKATINIFLFLFLTVCTFISAQTEDEKNTIKNTFAKIVEISKQKDVANAAGLLAYTGENTARNLKAALNFSDSEDNNSARRLLKKIKALFDISDSYTVNNVTKGLKNDVPTYVLSVSFKSGAQNLTSSFTFVKIDNKFLLAYAE
ncbi:MAG TPA: hypothetical protein PL041_07805 [Melioribacteraceae bacterium]|nr:hypothetical protein [Melioribacteraceae bacterium]